MSDIEIVELTPTPAAVVRGHVDHDGIAAFLGPAFGDVTRVVAEEGLTVTGPPFGRYQATGDGGWDVEAGLPVERAPEPRGTVVPGWLPGGSAATLLHVGPYDGLGAAYDAVAAWLVDAGLVPKGQPWESYLDGPGVEEPRTVVHLPCGAASGSA